MATTSNLFMLSLTVQPPSSTTQVILGQFSGTREQQLIIGSGSRLTLYRPDTHELKVKEVLSHDCFGIIRALSAFRLAGSNKDFVIIGSDSGRIAIIEYVPAENRFHRIHLETFGKSGVRRVIPGQYLAVDPKGRACMLASIEKNKLVYVLNRNTQAELTISSPLEAHKPQTLVFAMVGLDVGYENPIFAALEVDYGDSDTDPTGEAFRNVEKQLVYYELDLGLNHVVRKWADTVCRTANLLFQVPGGADGPSGVLVCGEEHISYHHSNQDVFRVPIPRRRGVTEDPERKRYITTGVMHRMRGAFFLLLQTEDGDLFKLTFEMVMGPDKKPTGRVARISIKYFDTIPVAVGLCVMKSGFLFAACENGNHLFYQFEKLGDEDEEEEFTSDDFPADYRAPYKPVYFNPRGPENIALCQTIDAMNPQIGCQVANLTDGDAPQIYSICGTGARSTFRTLKHGLDVLEIVESVLPSMPQAVWTTKTHRDEQFDAYIILSFANATLVLSIGENVEEVTETGFLASTNTIAVQLLGEDSLAQVHPRGIRHIRAGGEINEWHAPHHRTIVAATTNDQQVAVALSSGEIVYFEVDATGSLAEYEERREMSQTVLCLSLGPVPEGRVRSSFLAVGCQDNTVRILDLDPSRTLENRSVQGLTSQPHSLSIMSMVDSSSGGSSLYLHIGLHSGVYIRTVIDEATGDLIDTRTHFLGPHPVRLFRTSVKGQPTMLALTSRPWLAYSEPQTKALTLSPVNYHNIEWGWSFSSEVCPEGIVGIHGDYLRIFTIEDLNKNLSSESIPLSYTPRGFVKHPEYPLFYVVESDVNVLSVATRQKLISDSGVTNGDSTVLPPENFGYPRGRGHWASAIQVVDPVAQKAVLHSIELEENEAALCVAVTAFHDYGDEQFLIVGTGKDVVPVPRGATCGFIHVYRFEEDGRKIVFHHKTRVESPPKAMIPFQGRIAVGIERDIRIYDLGKRQLLRKAQAAPAVAHMVMSLATQGNRIIAADMKESVTYLVYKPQSNRLIPFADDVIPRWSTNITMIDYETTAGGDKFGNFWLLRCPEKASEQADEEGDGAILVERNYLHGTAHRVGLVAHFYTQDIPLSIQKTPLTAGGRDVLLWAGLQGSLGIMVPFVSREDANFFQDLEHHMRSTAPPLAGRDHLIYRSYYVPVKGVIDGDLCEQYLTLPREAKENIAGELDRDITEVERKVQEVRMRAAF